MDIASKLPAGKYILAISGGVDSVVLLDVLIKNNKSGKYDLVVAHFDHGIREDSKVDADLVKGLAQKNNLKFELQKTVLGSDASEADAREKRYQFLEAVKLKHKAEAIVTAHHQDDLIETSILNILRGTGRRGLSSLKDRPGLLRPLLEYSKKNILAYAKSNNLKWHEDSTNKDPKYLRNYVRLNVVAKMDDGQRKDWLNILTKAEDLNNKIDVEIQRILPKGLHKNQLVLNRRWFIMLPHDVAKEVLITLLAKTKAHDIDKKTIERLTVQIKTLPGGKILQAIGVDIYLTKRSARFKSR